MLNNSTDGINENEARTFIGLLFEPGDNVEGAWIGHATIGTKFGHRTGADWLTDESMQRLAEADTRGGGLYVGPNPGKHLHGSGKAGRRRDTDVALARFLFADFDGKPHAEVEAAINAAGLPEPTITAHTREPDGLGWHVYWKLKEPMHDLDLWTRTQKGFAKALGSDPTICNPSRLMRLPGSWNAKRAARCGILKTTEEFLCGESVRRLAVSVFSEPRRIHSTEGLGWSNICEATREFLEGSVIKGERNKRLFMAAADIHGNRVPIEDARDTLISAAMRHGLGQGEARKTIASAFAKINAAPSRPPSGAVYAKILNAIRGYPKEGATV